MRCNFEVNRRWANIRIYLILNFAVAYILFVTLLFYIENTNRDLIIILASALAVIFIIAVIFLVLFLLKTPRAVTLDEKSVVFRFPSGKSKKYSLNEIVYFATGALAYQRGGYCHSVIFEFYDKNRIAVSSIMIENYNQFFELIKSMGLEFYGFIGKNNWSRKNKPISKKWITYNEEEQLISSIGKESGIIFSYIIGAIILALNLFIVAGLIFGFENLRP